MGNPDRTRPDRTRPDQTRPDQARPDRTADDEIRRVIVRWAHTHAEFTRAIAAIDPSWGSRTFELGTGVVALQGAGLYVNRACAIGIDQPLDPNDLDELERRSAEVGVPPMVEVTPLTHPDTVDLLRRRGYRDDDRVVAHRRVLDRGEQFTPPPAWLRIDPARGDRLAAWQATSAIGWGHDTPDRRRANDVFAAAAAIVDGPGLVVAIDTERGEPVGCASTTVRDGTATLGGMSTVPSARRRGVQAALIDQRLAHAIESGCDLATSTTVPGSASARNLRRRGFAPWFEVTTVVAVDRRPGARSTSRRPS